LKEHDPYTGDFVTAGWRKLYRFSGLLLGVIFALVGAMFLLEPTWVVLFFNGVARRWGMAQSRVAEASLYLALAVAYMYAVTLLALGMFFHPEERAYAHLLIQAKSASAAVSLILCFSFGWQLILLSNAVVDGTIALTVAHLDYRGRKRER